MRTREARGRKAEYLKRFIGDCEVRWPFLFVGLWSSENGKTAADYKAESVIVKLMRKTGQCQGFGLTLECADLSALWSSATCRSRR